jgi:glutathione synthase/RimK-type ligase-like ATP-grasp enzyme
LFRGLGSFIFHHRQYIFVGAASITNKYCPYPNMYNILLISVANWDSLIELPALLKNAGCTLHIYAAPDSWVLNNDSFDSWIEAPAGSDNIDHLLSFLEQNAGKYDWIIPGDDIAVRLLNDRITDEGLFYKVMPLTKIENRAVLGSKAGFVEICNKYGIKTPRQLVYNDTQTLEEAGNYIGYPLIVKVDESEGGYGVFKCRNLEELTSRLKEVPRKNLVLQQMINGEDINTEVLYKDGVLMVYNYSRSITVMKDFGVSTRRLFEHNTDLDAVLEKMGQDIGLNGFGNVVFMRDTKTGEYYLIEIDMRPNSWMYYGRFTGNDFTQAVRNIINNKRERVKPASGFAPMMISLYKKDVYRIISTSDIKGAMYWLLNKDGCSRYIPRYDMKLLKSINSFLLQTARDKVMAKLGRKG